MMSRIYPVGARPPHLLSWQTPALIMYQGILRLKVPPPLSSLLKLTPNDSTRTCLGKNGDILPKWRVHRVIYRVASSSKVPARSTSARQNVDFAGRTY